MASCNVRIYRSNLWMSCMDTYKLILLSQYAFKFVEAFLDRLVDNLCINLCSLDI